MAEEPRKRSKVEKRVRNRYAKPLRRLQHGGEFGYLFGQLVSTTRHALKVSPEMRRATAERLKAQYPDGHFLDLDVHAVTLCIDQYLQSGDFARDWQQDPKRRRTFADAYLEFEADGMKRGTLRDGAPLPFNSFESALFLDYDGGDFDLWLDVLWDKTPHWGTEYFWLSGSEWESYSQMKIGDSSLIRQGRVYFDVTDLDEARAEELLLWLEDMRKERSYDLGEMRPAGVFRRPPRRKRGRPPGLPTRDRWGEAMPGRNWIEFAAGVAYRAERRKQYKQEYVAYWQNQAAIGAEKTLDDPARNFDRQLSRYLKLFHD